MTKIANFVHTVQNPQDLASFSIFLPDISEEVQEIIQEIFGSQYMDDLRAITENNPWHDQENVWEHVQVVFANLQLLLEFLFIEDEELRNRYIEYMLEPVASDSHFTRQDCLLIACAFHDLSKGQVRSDTDEFAGKTYVFLKDDGQTTGKGHERASAEIAQEYLSSRLPFSIVQHITALVADHDQFSLDYVQNNLSGYTDGSVESDIQRILADQPERAIELLLHIIADEYGAGVSQWKTEYLLEKVLTSQHMFEI